MSIVVSKVAEPYAEALLGLAKANGSLKETQLYLQQST
jgi:F0F1-type ATP synthase delta subunit